MEVKNGFSGSERKKKTRGKKAERGIAQRGKKKPCGKKRGVEKLKKEKGGEIKYNCLIDVERE
jgi:hypothetical protein